MNSINSLNDKNFTLNGIQYFRNYVSAVHGNKIEIYNCYERKDILVPLTHFSEFAVNGSAYPNAATLQTALLDIMYSRLTSGDSSTIDQNNVGRTINAGIVGPAPSYNPFFSVQSAVVQKLNAMQIVITSKETPVIVTASLLAESPTGNYVSKVYKYLFKPGKGNWGLNGTTVSGGHLEEINIRNYLVDDLLGQPNAVIENLGNIPDGNFIAKANTSDWNFNDLGTEGVAGEKTYYFSYETNDVLYFAQFTGTPGSYGLSYEAKFTTADFVSSTDSRITDVPNLEEVLDQAGNINISQLNNDGDGTSPYATEAAVNGLTVSVNQAAAEMYMKNDEGTILATVNLAFLNNEGTTFFYNESNQKLELKNDIGDILSQVPVSAFVSNLMQSVAFNAATPSNLEFKDAEGHVIESVTARIINIEGLQSALDNKANKDGSNASGTWPVNVTGNAANTLKWNELRRDSGQDFDPPYYMTIDSTGNSSGYVTKANAIQSLGINLKANDNEVIKTTGTQIKSGNLALYDTLVHLKPEGGAVWSSKIDEANNLIFTNDYETTIPSLRINQMGNVEIPNGKLSVLSAPSGDYDVVRLQEFNAWLSVKANQSDVLHKTGNETKTSGHIAFDSPVPLKFNATNNYIKGMGGDGDDIMVIERTGISNYNFKFNGNARVTGTLKASYAVELTDVAVLDQVNSISFSAAALASSGKANENEVVKLTGFQTISGIKNFTNEIKTAYGISTPNYINYEINGEYCIRDLANDAMLAKFYTYTLNAIDFYRKIFGTGAKFSEQVQINDLLTVKGVLNTGTFTNNGNATFKEDIIIGISDEIPTQKKALKFNVGGYGIAGQFGIDSDGDKIVLYHGADYDARIGIGSFGEMYFKSYSTIGGGGYSFLTQSLEGNQITALKINGDGTLNSQKNITGKEKIISGSGYGFYNKNYLTDQRNPIWAFDSSPSYGLSYYQGHAIAADTGADSIGLTFGNILDPPIRFRADGSGFFSGAVNVKDNNSFRFGNTDVVWSIQKNTDLLYGGFSVVKEGADIAFRIDNDFITYTARQLRLGGNGVNAMDAVTLSQLNSAIAISANAVADNYIPKTGPATKTGTLTFTDAPIIPQATLAGHPVTKVQFEAHSTATGNPHNTEYQQILGLPEVISDLKSRLVVTIDDSFNGSSGWFSNLNINYPGSLPGFTVVAIDGSGNSAPSFECTKISATRWAIKEITPGIVTIPE